MKSELSLKSTMNIEHSSLFFIDAGFSTEFKPGIAHVAEHLLFKNVFLNQKKQMLFGIWGNAYTKRDYMSFWVSSIYDRNTIESITECFLATIETKKYKITSDQLSKEIMAIEQENAILLRNDKLIKLDHLKQMFGYKTSPFFLPGSAYNINKDDVNQFIEMLNSSNCIRVNTFKSDAKYIKQNYGANLMPKIDMYPEIIGDRSLIAFTIYADSIERFVISEFIANYLNLYAKNNGCQFERFKTLIIGKYIIIYTFINLNKPIIIKELLAIKDDVLDKVIHHLTADNHQIMCNILIQLLLSKYCEIQSKAELCMNLYMLLGQKYEIDSIICRIAKIGFLNIIENIEEIRKNDLIIIE